MRRSLAPSQRHKSGVNSAGLSNSKVLQVTDVPVTPPIRPSLSHLNETPSCDSSKEAFLKFHVVYGKPSKKKHKTWDGDGILEIRGKTGILKDVNGKIVGQSSNCAKSDLSDGSLIFVGSKEVEILGKFEVNSEHNDDGILKRKCEDVSRRSVKKIRKNVNSVQNAENNFVMPLPDDEHQWQCNPDNLPITPVIVDRSLSNVLRPHQKEGVIFLYNCVTGLRDMKYKGAILADEMGLGKTLQCIALTWTLMKSGPYGGVPLLKKVLIVVPSSLVINWKNEFIRWIGSFKVQPFVIDNYKRPKDYFKSRSPILIISYEMLVKCFEEIVKTSFDLLICDEGHRLKNANNRSTCFLNQLQCGRRILLTGTPIQNDLEEFYTLTDFVNPGIFGSRTDYLKQFVKPILASKQPKAEMEVVEKGKSRSDELNRIAKEFILRRTQRLIGKYLPKKTEYVVFCKPTQLQKCLYSTAVKLWTEQMHDLGGSVGPKHLSAILALKKICNHPILLKNTPSEGCKVSLHNWLGKEIKSEFKTMDSSKMLIVESIVMYTMKVQGEKLILVSNYTQTLDLFVRICHKCNCEFLRFDGNTPVADRDTIVRKFNGCNTNFKVLLLSSKAGGVGLNLTGASRLLLYDSDWNPATDLQAMARIWREGQTKNVHIYRLLTVGTIEEKIFQRQLKKADLNDAVVDVQSKTQDSIKLSDEELRDLFTYDGTDECLTHTALNCHCSGDGSVVEPVEEDCPKRERDCQIELGRSEKMADCRMNHLLQWEHHGPPFNESLISDMYLSDVDCVNFVFRNKLSLKVFTKPSSKLVVITTNIFAIALEEDTAVCVTIHRCDPLRMKDVLKRPSVRVHLMDVSAKNYRRSAFGKNAVDVVQTLPFDHIQRRSVVPTWEEDLILMEPASHVVAVDCVFIFELIELETEEILAWAFLKPLAANGKQNTGAILRLQLFKPAKSRQSKSDDNSLPMAFLWYMKNKSSIYKSTMLVSVHSIDSKLVVRPDKNTAAVNNTKTENRRRSSQMSTIVNMKLSDAEKELIGVVWSRIATLSCKLPNRIDASLPAGPDGGMSVSYSNSGLLVACQTSNAITVFTYKGSCYFVLSGHQGLIYDLSWSPDDSFLLSSSADTTACVWNIKLKLSAPVAILSHPSYVYCCTWLSKTLAVTGCYDKILRLWNLSEVPTIDSKKSKFSSTVSLLYNVIAHQPAQCIVAHNARINSVASLNSDEILASGDGEGIIVLWRWSSSSSRQLEMSKQIALRELRGQVINKLSCHPGGKRILVATRDSKLRMVDIKSSSIIQWFHGNVNSKLQSGSCFCGCGSKVMACSEDGSVSVWEANTGERIAVYKALYLPDSPASLDFHPKDNMFAIVSHKAGAFPSLILSVFDRDATAATGLAIEYLDNRPEYVGSGSSVSDLSLRSSRESIAARSVPRKKKRGILRTLLQGGVKNRHKKGFTNDGYYETELGDSGESELNRSERRKRAAHNILEALDGDGEINHRLTDIIKRMDKLLTTSS